MKVYDYWCNNGHKNEVFVPSIDTLVACPDCGAPTNRMTPAPQSHLEGITGSFPGAASKWVSRRLDKIKQERKEEKEHGKYTGPRWR